MRVTTATYRIEGIVTDVEFVDDEDLTFAAVPTAAEVTFRDGRFDSLALIGTDRHGCFGVARISDYKGLSEPWRTVAESIVKACPGA